MELNIKFWGRKIHARKYSNTKKKIIFYNASKNNTEIALCSVQHIDFISSIICLVHYSNDDL